MFQFCAGAAPTTRYTSMNLEGSLEDSKKWAHSPFFMVYSSTQRTIRSVAPVSLSISCKMCPFSANR